MSIDSHFLVCLLSNLDFPLVTQLILLAYQKLEQTFPAPSYGGLPLVVSLAYLAP